MLATKECLQLAYILNALYAIRKTDNDHILNRFYRYKIKRYLCSESEPDNTAGRR